MATAKPSRRVLYFDADQEPDLEPAAPTDAADLLPEASGDASLCPSCGEPLTWHEQPCAATATATATATAPAAETKDAPPVARASGSFAYALGHLVVPATQQQAHPVVWRGQLRERSPATGLVHRINVYRLGDGYWDCYREEELQAA